MQNQFAFPNQANNMNIMFYKQEIMKLIDEIIEIDLEIFKHQYNHQQMMNQCFMQNQNMMMMPNMPFIQNQLMNPQLILEQKIKLYREKLEKLTEEKIEKKKSMSMKQMFPSWNNNNFINPMNNPMNLNPILNRIKNLLVKVMMEDGKRILVQCELNDKLETVIKKFQTKVQNSDDFDFFIIKEEKAKINLTVKEIGINDDDFYIFARKKLKNSNENNVIEQNIQYNKEYIDKNYSNDNLEINPVNLRPKINLLFEHTSGLKISFNMDQNKTFKEAVIMFCNKVGIPISAILKGIYFLFNASKLNIEDNRKLAQISSNAPHIKIYVIDFNNIIGA